MYSQCDFDLSRQGGILQNITVATFDLAGLESYTVTFGMAGLESNMVTFDLAGLESYMVTFDLSLQGRILQSNYADV